MRYLFGIITNGKRPDKLQALVDSIRAAGAGDYEIVIAGEIANVPDGVKFIEMLDAARTGRLGAMRNALCESSEAEIFIILDDDMVLDAAFIKELEAFGDDWDGAHGCSSDGTRNCVLTVDSAALRHGLHRDRPVRVRFGRADRHEALGI